MTSKRRYVAGHEIPFHRTYSRVLIAGVVLATVLFPLFPEAPTGLTHWVRTFLFTFGMGMASLFAPVLVYAGIRTGSRGDAIIGIAGMSTLLYWIPVLIFF